MASLADIGNWVTANEQLLSGLAAMLALAGVTVSVIGMGFRSVRRRRVPISPEIGQGAATEPKPPIVPSTRGAVLQPGSAEADEPLLAVLAFENLSSDPEMQFFSDGVSEEIIQRLARGCG